MHFTKPIFTKLNCSTALHEYFLQRAWSISFTITGNSEMRKFDRVQRKISGPKEDEE